MFLTLTVFSQKDTLNKDSVVILSKSTAIKVAKDLVRKDSLEAELNNTKQFYSILSQKSSIQDSIIKTFQKKEMDYVLYTQNQYQQISTLEKYSKSLEKQVKKEKSKKTINKVIYGLVISGLLFLYISK